MDDGTFGGKKQSGDRFAKFYDVAGWLSEVETSGFLASLPRNMLH